MDLHRRLRIVVITDAAAAAARGRSVEETVRAALHAGAGAVQLRDKEATARELLAQAVRLRAMTRDAGALLFVNDRLDVALGAGADGVHLGPEDLPVAVARRAAGDALLIGYSTDHPDRAREAVAAGADYLGCGDVFGTASKGNAGAVIGVGRLEEVVSAVDVPVVAIGGVDLARAVDVAATRAAGVAVISAVMAAPDPRAAVRALLSAFARRDLEGVSAPGT